MLERGRAMTRHQRDRNIKKHKKLLDTLWRNGWGNRPEGILAKGTYFHHHHCNICSNQKYNRAKFKRTNID